MLMELTMPLPCMQRRPASITSHLELSIMIGTRAMSGSDAISCRKRTIAALLSSMASSMLMTMIWAPLSTCWRATARACSYWPFRIMRANALEPVTVGGGKMDTGARADSFIGGSEMADMGRKAVQWQPEKQAGVVALGRAAPSPPLAHSRCLDAGLGLSLQRALGEGGF